VSPLERLRIGVAVAIIVLWAGSLVVDWLNPAYDTPAALNTFALIIAGFLFGPTLIRANKNGGKDESG